MSDKPKKPPVKLTDKQREALDKGRKSFKSGDAWTKEQQAKGVAASIETRQEAAQARTFAAILAEELNVINKTTGEPRKNGVAKKLVEAMEKAKPKEAAKLFEVLRDTLGEAPTQKIDINANVKTIGNWREVLNKEQDQPQDPVTQEEQAAELGGGCVDNCDSDSNGNSTHTENGSKGSGGGTVTTAAAGSRAEAETATAPATSKE